MKSIDVLISAYGSQLNYFIEKLQRIDGVRYLIGHQNYNEKTIDAYPLKDYIDYYPLESLGVTYSRNFLIQKAQSDIIYFCDDDITFLPNALKNLREIHTQYKQYIILTSVLNENYVPRKNYPLKISKVKRHKFFSVGTIEISAKRKSIENAGCLFPEDMGAGNKQYPVGDEAVFLASCADNNLSMIYYPVSLVIHPQESSGLISSPSHSKAIGLSIKRVYKKRKLCSLMILFLYLSKQLLKNRFVKNNCLGKIKNVLQGYFNK